MKSVSWVVYQMTVKGHDGGMNVVCEQREWDVMEQVQPGRHTLIRDHIVSESEAEKLARGTSGDPKPRQPRLL